MQDKMKSFFSSSPPPTSEELQKYLEGTLSAEERKALERRMESADLYTEGMDGIETLPDKQALSDITNELNARIDQRINREKRFNYAPYWSVAAVLLLICGLVFTFVGYQSRQSKESMVYSESELAPAQDLAFSPSVEKHPKPSVQILKNNEPTSPRPEVATDNRVLKGDEKMQAEEIAISREVVPDTEIKFSEGSPSRTEAANDNVSRRDHSMIYNEMFAFAETQVTMEINSDSASEVRMLEEVVAIGYGSKRKESTERKEKKKPMASESSSRASSKMKKPSAPVANDIKKEEAFAISPKWSNYDLLQGLKGVLYELNNGNVANAEQQLAPILNTKSSYTELALWLKGMLHLKKNEKQEALSTLRALGKSDSAIGKEATKILEMLD